METYRIKNLFEYIKTIHLSDNFDDYFIDCHGKLRPVLRKYQKLAVKWMLKREKCKIDGIKCNEYDVRFPSGGILADEMGLGKTVEVLACILCNPFSSVDMESPAFIKKKIVCKRKHELIEDNNTDDDAESNNTPSSKKKKRGRSKEKVLLKEKSGLFSSKYNALRTYYETVLSQMSFTSSRQQPVSSSLVKCFCDNNDSDELNLVQCEDCNKWQHAECVGIVSKVIYGNVKCPQCWTKAPLVPSKTTLIITPSSILDQWINEIEKHVDDPSFKLWVYNGVKNHNYVQPTVLAEYDVILTTYNVLCSDLNFLPNESERKLRHAKRYFAPSSPLTCIKFWRICLDEAQMVEGYTSKTALMASQLNAIHRWAVTGTPIQKSIHDLYGLVHFLRISPFENLSPWQDLNSSDEELFKFLSHIMWRSSKNDVLADLGVPPQTVITHWLHFSPVEGYFYRTIHTECATSFRNKLCKFDDLNVKLNSIDRTQLQTLLLPLLGVRQACTHPQVVRGKFVRFKHTMTMEELMVHMVSKARLDADVALRQFVSALHGIAAINIIECDWSGAVENYRRVLQLSSEYKNIIKVDSLQMIHCLCNLAEVLENHGTGIPPTLRDSKLREEAEELEKNYLENYEKKFTATLESLNKLSETIAHLCRGQTLSLTSWWEEVINNESNDEDLLNKIKTYLDDNDVPGQQSITSKLSGLHTVHREFAVWIATADELRIETLDSLSHLQILPKSLLFDQATLCHLNQKRRRKGMQRCPICQTELLLKKYEAHIFSVNKNNINLEEDSEESGNEEEGEGKKLKETKLFKSSKEGSWKPTPHERMLHVIANHAKRISTELAEDGSRHILLLETVRKEFKWMRALWRNMSDQIYGTDELAMAKLRLRLPVYEDELNNKQKKKTDIFIVDAHEVPIMLIRLQQESNEAEAALKRTSGTLFYLQNLQKSGGTELDPCPVCKESLKEKWSVLNCGHCYCFECIPTLLKMGGNEIDCPLCRIKTPKENVSYVVARPVNNDESPMEVKGSHSSKVTAVVSELLSLIKQDSSVKVLIFSTWEKVLDVIRDALIQNDISFRRLGTGEKFQNSLAQFKAGSITVLLLPLKLGSKGLNLTEATHLFFVEPVLNPAEELQAVGRIHRIGQTKPTFVHRFVVHNTIEERMLSSLETGGQEEWAKENITLRKLNDLFILREDNSNTGEEECVIENENN